MFAVNVVSARKDGGSFYKSRIIWRKLGMRSMSSCAASTICSWDWWEEVEAKHKHLQSPCGMDWLVLQWGSMKMGRWVWGCDSHRETSLDSIGSGVGGRDAGNAEMVLSTIQAYATHQAAAATAVAESECVLWLKVRRDDSYHYEYHIILKI